MTQLNTELGDRLLQVAARVAILPPPKQPNYSVEARVRWTEIHELRAILDAAGIDWRALQRANRTTGRGGASVPKGLVIQPRGDSHA